MSNAIIIGLAFFSMVLIGFLLSFFVYRKIKNSDMLFNNGFGFFRFCLIISIVLLISSLFYCLFILPFTGELESYYTLGFETSPLNPINIFLDASSYIILLIVYLPFPVIDIGLPFETPFNFFWIFLRVSVIFSFIFYFRLNNDAHKNKMLSYIGILALFFSVCLSYILLFGHLSFLG